LVPRLGAADQQDPRTPIVAVADASKADDRPQAVPVLAVAVEGGAGGVT
jgi:hypothetical protein